MRGVVARVSRAVSDPALSRPVAVFSFVLRLPPNGESSRGGVVGADQPRPAQQQGQRFPGGETAVHRIRANAFDSARDKEHAAARLLRKGLERSLGGVPTQIKMATGLLFRGDREGQRENQGHTSEHVPQEGNEGAHAFYNARSQRTVYAAHGNFRGEWRCFRALHL